VEKQSSNSMGGGLGDWWDLQTKKKGRIHRERRLGRISKKSRVFFCADLIYQQNRPAKGSQRKKKGVTGGNLPQGRKLCTSMKKSHHCFKKLTRKSEWMQSAN